MPIKRLNAPAVRGAMLEEILLWLLRFSGYRTVRQVGNDQTLKTGPAGLEVRGRGTNHQIDAIADYQVQQPFANRQRLLVEAKCLRDAVGLPIARNAVGVLKDVSEFWHTGQSSQIKRRPIHYMYALFSSSGFASTTQEYAYAQDIYLIPLHFTRFLKPLIEIIWDMAGKERTVRAWWPRDWSLKDFREAFRDYLERRALTTLLTGHDTARKALSRLQSQIDQIGFALLGTFSGGFPVFLTPAPGVNLDRVVDGLHFRPRWDDDSWFLERDDGARMFSFDLPEDLFRMYAHDGVLTAEAALNMKQAEMGRLQVIDTSHEHARIIQLYLDEGWIQTLLRERGQA